MPSASSRGGPSCGARSAGAPPGRCGGRSATETRAAPSSRGQRGLLGRCARARRRRGANSACISSRSPGWRLVRQHVVGDARSGRGAGRAPAPAARSSARCAGTTAGMTCTTTIASKPAQPPPGPHPGVGAGPGQRPHGAREGSARRARRRARPAHRGTAGRVQVAHDTSVDVVPGLGQLVREGRRVGRDAALVGVGGADDGDLQRRATDASPSGTPSPGQTTVSRAHHAGRTSSASEPIMMPLTMSSTVLAGK